VTAARPRVILHNALSLDGRLDGFEADLALYYEIAGRFGAQAILAGSNTILAAFAEAVEEPEAEQIPDPAQADARPLLVVVDGRGRIRMWDHIRHQPYWRGVVALGCRATPQEALALQRAAGIEAFVIGERRVDLARALSLLGERYDVDVVRVDSGGRLNAALLRAGLVDEVSLLFHPQLAGPAGKLPLIAAPFTGRHRPPSLELLSVEEQGGGVLWARYRVAGADPSDLAGEEVPG
jgi:2,5-diamino-6-(ribosylamino)-4(3H)-pyrimidinone 5'-phosphate reductase